MNSSAPSAKTPPPSSPSRDLTQLSAAELSAALIAREVSSVEVTVAHLDRIAAIDGELHAFLHVSATARADAAAIDAREPQ